MRTDEIQGAKGWQLAEGEEARRSAVPGYVLVVSSYLVPDRYNSMLELFSKARPILAADSEGPANALRYYLGPDAAFFVGLAIAAGELDKPVGEQRIAGHVALHQVRPGHEAEGDWLGVLETHSVDRLAEVGTLLVAPEDRGKKISIALVQAAVAELRRRQLLGVAATGLDNEIGLRSLNAGGFCQIARLVNSSGQPFRYLILNDQGLR